MSLQVDNGGNATRESTPPHRSGKPDIECWNQDSLPSNTTLRSNLRLLNEQLTALNCSSRGPGNLIARAMCDAAVTVVGGFQTPWRECLRLLLRGSQPVVVCPSLALRLHSVLELHSDCKYGHHASHY